MNKGLDKRKELIVELLNIDEVKTAEQAREIAIDWQSSLADGESYWSELAEYADYFRELADKFPELEDEFKENAII